MLLEEEEQKWRSWLKPMVEGHNGHLYKVNYIGGGGGGWLCVWNVSCHQKQQNRWAKQHLNASAAAQRRDADHKDGIWDNSTEEST